MVFMFASKLYHQLVGWKKSDIMFVVLF